ncbi:MAG: hypothetical protein IKK99_03630, partial [Oscillospiraceae bacterium]|nr:hypothetical protein [Oscillospiraceae bacterium]
DLRDVLCGTHNQLSPQWMRYVRLMIGAMFFIGMFMLVLLIRAKFRIAKWRKEGVFDEEKQRKMTDEQIAAKRAAEAAAALEAEKAEESAEETKE